MKARHYRRIATEQMKGNYGANIYITLLYSALVTLSLLIPFGPILFGSALSVGLLTFYLGIVRTGKANVKNLFGSFNGNIANVFVMNFSSAIFLMLWAFVPIVGWIIVLVKSYSYAMAPYILIDNPEMNGCDAITASRYLMRGKKFKLFCLELSYIGWHILCALTLGILYIWVTPRMSVARAAFYNSIKQPAEEPMEEEREEALFQPKITEIPVVHEPAAEAEEPIASEETEEFPTPEAEEELEKKPIEEMIEVIEEPAEETFEEVDKTQDEA